ncbi:hypothetical protein BU23DRAFT_293953 [Bimuria novae-zelandiae CBS 107.79]|uniref:Uncharacterized protein n=1 Tax=Bimuria novae-zelandiae CBS 107.79 TaxID=1447943 RepID=A0A6A5VKV7_9PLEO|nr:hypothetical protein BU23DRAFT_293953 [Bimuria novae-zelandiae CBS 107.79]
MIHLACPSHRYPFEIVPALQAFVTRPALLPGVMQYSRTLNLTGLENVELELPTDVFLSLFQATVPPFPTPDHPFHDPTLLGAGTYLAYTRQLTLIFTNTNPWYDLHEGPWVEDTEGLEPRERANICLAGLIVDWILTYAWHHRYLQHIPRITLKGDIQDWVKEKLYKVFARTHPEEDVVAGFERIEEIEHHGERGATGLWNPTEHYPPTCGCKINCCRLRCGVVEPEIPIARGGEGEWGLDLLEISSPAEEQPWFNKTDWN